MAGIDENTLLLLHGEDLTDSSDYNVPITNNGVQVSNEQSKFGGKSLDEIRVSNVSRWTSNFIPPTEPYSKEVENPNIYAKLNGVWRPASSIYTKVNGAR